MQNTYRFRNIRFLKNRKDFFQDIRMKNNIFRICFNGIFSWAETFITTIIDKFWIIVWINLFFWIQFKGIFHTCKSFWIEWRIINIGSIWIKRKIWEWRISVSRDFTDDSEKTLPAPLEIDAVTLPAPLEIDAVIKLWSRLLFDVKFWKSSSWYSSSEIGSDV